MSRNLYMLLSLALSLTVSGCSVINEGAVNYRKTSAFSKVASQNPAASEKNVDDPNPMPLEFKYKMPSNSSLIINNNGSDTVAIFLESAFIKDFVAGFHLSTGFRCPIAIIVNAYEVGEGNEKNYFDYSPEGFKKGRLVFYSDDVAKGQFLNFSYLPVYGPAIYKGKPLALEITILKVDTSSQALKSLLGELASMGKKVLALDTPVVKLLNALGGSMLEGGHDDRIFKYYMTLNAVPPQGSLSSSVDGAHYPVLHEGHYVFVRHNNRAAPENWDMNLGQDEGRLYYNKDHSIKKPDGTSSAIDSKLYNASVQDNLYRENTYLVLQIKKNLPVAEYDIPSFASLEASLRSEAVLNSTTTEKIKDVASKIAADYLSKAKRQTLENMFRNLCLAWNLPGDAGYRDKILNQYVADLSNNIGVLSDEDKIILSKVLSNGNDPDKTQALQYANLKNFEAKAVTNALVVVLSSNQPTSSQ